MEHTLLSIIVVLGLLFFGTGFLLELADIVVDVVRSWRR